MTPQQIGYVDYIFGKFLYDNPYDGNSNEYVEWYDGWNNALKDRPHLEPKDDNK